MAGTAGVSSAGPGVKNSTTFAQRLASNPSSEEADPSGERTTGEMVSVRPDGQVSGGYYAVRDI
ncbi:MAG: hypothetical protein UY12_C0013G0001, partial [Parcubacteria group bacterium GW2011_GWA2_47_8b]